MRLSPSTDSFLARDSLMRMSSFPTKSSALPSPAPPCPNRSSPETRWFPVQMCASTEATHAPLHTAAPHSCQSGSQTPGSRPTPPPRWRCITCSGKETSSNFSCYLFFRHARPDRASFYSFLSSTAGLVRAALSVCQRTEKNATIVVMRIVTTNTHPYPEIR